MENVSYYEAITIPELKSEIVHRLLAQSGDGIITEPFNSKTRKGDLITWLIQDDNERLVEKAKAEMAERAKAFNQGVPLTFDERHQRYTRQNGTGKLTTPQARQLHKTAVRALKRLADREMSSS